MASNRSLKNLRICLVTGQYPPQVGGVGNSAFRVATLLANQGSQVHVVVLQKHPKPLPFDESFTSSKEENILVHRVEVFHPQADGQARTPQAEILTRYNREMFQALDYFQRQYEYEVLHAFFLYPAGFIAGLVGRLHSVKTIASIRGNDVGKYAFDPLRLAMIRSALDHADFVTSVATNLIDLADRVITPIAEKSRTILNSVPRPRLGPISKPDLNLRGTVIGTAGLFRYKKGLVYLFRALSSLKEHLDFTLLLLGDFFKPEDREPHLRALDELGLRDRTIITGKVTCEKMPNYLQLFDLLVFPSLYSEGCPLSMLEAMAMRKAIVATKTGAIPEIIRDRHNGLLVDPGSSQEIARAIEELVYNVQFREELAGNAAATVDEMRPERELREWVEVYETILT